MQDALGNEIKLGEYYGYSRNSNGVTQIKVGEAINLNEKSVTLEVIYYKTALYERDPSEPIYKAEKDKISVKGNLIFPVDIGLINN